MSTYGCLLRSTKITNYQPMVDKADDSRGLAERLREALKQSNKTQAKLAEEVGVSEQAVGKWLRTGQVSRNRIPAVARSLNASVEWILDGKEPRFEVREFSQKVIEFAKLLANAPPEKVDQALEMLGYKPERRSGEERRQDAKPVPQNRRKTPDRREGHRLERIIRPSNKRKDEEDEEPPK
jgi:transcriptional regulator with XRE-family HTH domain